MTPEEEALRDAFLAECWAPVREYHPPVDPRPRPVQKTVDKPRKRAA